jgi:putative glutamine amidotransferase
MLRLLPNQPRIEQAKKPPDVPPIERRTTGRVRRVERKQPAPLPVQTIHLSELGADLLLPKAGETADQTLALYRDRLDASGVFDPGSLASLKTEPSAPFDPDQPVVGIILSEPPAFFGDRGVRELTEAMQELGMRVVLIPPCADLLMPHDPAGRRNGIRSMLRTLDGLIGPGGDDVDPAIYGERNQHAEDTNVRRDRFEADLALAAKHEDLFMFGICRSHQLWNAADGGSLVQDLQAEGLVSLPLRQRKTAIPFDQPFVLRDDRGDVVFENRIALDPKSRMAEVTKRASFVTNANHHQAVDRSGVDLEIVGSLAGHSIIEATERWNTFTVQWHPEAMWSDPVQRRLLGTVGRRAALFRAVKRVQGQVTPEAVERWYQKRFGLLDESDARWLRRELIPHRFGRFLATASVDGR